MPSIWEETSASLRTKAQRNSALSGNSVDTLSRRPTASAADSSSVCRRPSTTGGGQGGRGSGTIASTRPSGTVVVEVVPVMPRFTAVRTAIKER